MLISILLVLCGALIQGNASPVITVTGVVKGGTAPPDVLVAACAVLSENAPKEAQDPLNRLTHHASTEVRLAAFEASLKSGTEREGLLRAALAETDVSIVKWALRALGPNVPNDFIPLMLEWLSVPDLNVHAEADTALAYLLSHASSNTAERFTIFEQAFRDGRWGYGTAPRLTARYAVALEKQGQLHEAATAYETAEAAYTREISQDTSRLNRPDRDLCRELGATMLYRLFQVRRKQGNTTAAKAVLNRMAAEYPAGTPVYLEDSPGVGRLGSHTTPTVGRLTTLLNDFLKRMPITITVVAERSVLATGEPLRVKVTITNTTDEKLVLHCIRTERGNALVPAGRPSVVVDTRHWTGFHEIWSGKALKLPLVPSEKLVFASSVLTRNIKGNERHIFDFTFNITCDRDSGEVWSERVLSNSVVVEVEQE